MTRDQLAYQLNGREYGDEITPDETAQAAKDGLLVVYGYSDDNTEFAGLFRDEAPCYGGCDIFVHREGMLEDHDAAECNCKFCGYAEMAKKCAKIEAVWDSDGYSWTYKTDLPHAEFDILEDGEKFCRGMVIDAKDLPTI